MEIISLLPLNVNKHMIFIMLPTAERYANARLCLSGFICAKHHAKDNPGGQTTNKLLCAYAEYTANWGGIGRCWIS